MLSLRSRHDNCHSTILTFRSAAPGDPREAAARRREPETRAGEIPAAVPS